VQAFLPAMQQNDFGRVIVISSPTATKPKAKSGPYAVGKAAQDTLMMTLAAELEGTGVTANVIQVHSIDTENKRAADPEKYARWTTPEEIAAAIEYLISEAGGRVNGARLPLFS
jgi:NAD(P)-dependent dehydrogenase (short-subunit alcohol dehydrogenase family)